MKIAWADQATLDIERIFRRIAHDNPAAAQRLARALLLAGDSLAVLPNRGRRGRSTGTRELVVVYPYVIVYSVATETVDILRVWHGAQDR